MGCGWLLATRPRRGRARVRLMSAATQTRRKFALEMGRPGHKTDKMGPGRRALGRLLCPFYSKRTGPDRIGSRGGDGLRFRAWACMLNVFAADTWPACRIQKCVFPVHE